MVLDLGQFQKIWPPLRSVYLVAVGFDYTVDRSCLYFAEHWSGAPDLMDLVGAFATASTKCNHLDCIEHPLMQQR